jgi:xanthine dehydrogenase accessory factor
MAITDYMRDALDQLSVVARIKGKVADVARAAIGQVTVDLGGGVTASVVSSGETTRPALDTPAGLDLGARTPGEIALSILARIVEVRRAGAGHGIECRVVGHMDQ